MSYVDLYMGGSPLVAGDGADPQAIIFGVPFDSTHSYKPGTRFGPEAIRDAFNNIEIFHADLQVDLESVSIQDLGNTKHTVSSSEMLNMVKKITAELIQKNRQLFILGGEHLITYGTYTALPENTGYVVFDAHYDLRDGFADTKMSHAAYLRRIIEERGAENIIHVGARAFVREELEFLTAHKIRTISDAEIRDGKGPKLLRDATSVFDSTYVSCDLDVLDPAFAPGVGNPEADGITSREFFSMIRALKENKITCTDIVELNPTYDNGSTAALAAKIISVVMAMNLK